VFWLVIATSHANAGGKSIAGWVEHAWLNGNQISVHAKLDTGAKSSSISAADYEKFMRDGRDWVRFSIVNAKGKTLEIARPVERVARVRRAGTATEERPVILLKVCVAGYMEEAEFTLADRSSMNYQILIGREFLKDRILVDSARSFIASGECNAR
jgi:hypothetical protein